MYLVMLLAFLQCFAPLLHAHTLGMTDVSGVHIHVDMDMPDYAAADVDHPTVTIAKTELPAIGMAQEYKKDYVFFAADDQGALPPDFPLPSLSSVTSVVTVQLYQTAFRFHHPLPFSQAPPALQY